MTKDLGGTAKTAEFANAIIDKINVAAEAKGLRTAAD